MNKLFKTGEYVLLSDCEAYDKKHGLEKDATMWMVARKMEVGKFGNLFMDIDDNEDAVGIYDGDKGTWWACDLDYKLTVQEALYRSENGLTLDELAVIPCGFDYGKEYVCVGGGNRVYSEGITYRANGKVIVDNSDNGSLVSGCNCGLGAKFKPLPKTQPKEWVPSVGDEVLCLLHGDWHRCEILKFNDIGAAAVLLIDSKLNGRNLYWSADFKSINKERERVINSSLEYFDF